MRLDIPDPEFTGSRRARRSFALAVKLAAGFVALIWAVFVLDWLLPIDLNRYGLRPRDVSGLIGLLTTPLLHGSLAHIVSNTAPLFIGLVAILFLYPNVALRALPAIWIGSAALAWVFARPSVHIGASGLVYGLLAFVFVSGLLRRDLRSMVVSFMVFFLYGSMIWGVLPAGRSMSWELHTTGMVLGIALAVHYRAWDRTPVKRYDWDEDDDEPGAPSGLTDEPDGDQPWRDRNWP